MIQTRTVTLPHGISLQCRESGSRGRPVLMFLHGFPEGAFIWDELLLHFARPENGGYHCVAPYLRGFGESSQPQATEAYRAKHLVQDLVALISAVCTTGTVECLVAHDWGGAVAWNLANQQPQWLKRLAVINSPHPGAFLRELQTNAAQQAASQYMHFLCRPDAESLLAENDFQRLFAFFNTPEGHAPAWLTEAVRAQYQQVGAVLRGIIHQLLRHVARAFYRYSNVTLDFRSAQRLGQSLSLIQHILSIGQSRGFVAVFLQKFRSQSHVFSWVSNVNQSDFAACFVGNFYRMAQSFK